MNMPRVLALVVCAAPPVLRISGLIKLLQADGWTVCLTATPTVASWIDREALARQTGYPVRMEWRKPGEPETRPAADAVALVPATFNAINKWTPGINDTLALGILNEALGNGVSVYAFPNVKAGLASHPRYETSLRLLREAAVMLLPLPSELDWRIVTERIGRPPNP